jgi:DNA-binding winged helix-turn-helix (wHTH) protein
MDLRVSHALEINGVTVDFGAERLRNRSGADVALRPQSFAVLRHLAENAERIVTKDELMRAVWRGIAVTDDSLVQCIHDIRRAIGDETQTVLRNVPKLGYQLVLPPETPPAKRRGVAALAAGLLALLAVAIAWWLSAPEPAPGRPPSIAVLPFDDMSADGSLRYMGDGVADDIISMLARSPDVLVMARNSSFAYGGQPVDVRKVGAELGTDYVLEGSVRREGDKAPHRGAIERRRHWRAHLGRALRQGRGGSLGLAGRGHRSDP